MISGRGILKAHFCAPYDIDTVGLSVVHLSPLGSQLSFGQHPSTRIENVVDWDTIAKKYRSLFGVESDGSSIQTESENKSNTSDAAQTNAPNTVNAAAVNLV